MKKLNVAEGFFGTVGLGLFAVFMYLAYGADTASRSLMFKALGAAADALLLLLPLSWLRGRWKFAALAVPFVVAALAVANVLYFRNFGDLIPGSAYLGSSLADARVAAGALATLHACDVVPLLACLLPVAVAIVKRRELARTDARRGFRVLVAGGAVLVWAACYVGAFRRTGIYSHTSDIGEISGKLFSSKSTDWMYFYENHGFTGYAALAVRSAASSGILLDAEDREYVRRYLAAKSAEFCTADSLGVRNLVFVIVESLPGRMLELPDAPKVMPVLTSLAHSDSAVYVPRCRVLAGHGRSSDAQFIYNTGLLPLRDEALVTNYASKNYPSLAKALDYPSAEVIGENRRLWSHAATSESYGFDRLLDGLADDSDDQDSIIFAEAARVAAAMEQPFYLSVASLSMHDPYDGPRVTPSPQIEGLPHDDDRDREYFERGHHFDASLGRFIEALRHDGLFDNTVIVIAGDHEIRASSVPDYLHDDSVPLIIVNPGMKAARTAGVTQADVFPTVLQLMGVPYTFAGVPYTGLGRSIFLPGEPHEPSEEDYRVSQMVIKSDFVDHADVAYGKFGRQ